MQALGGLGDFFRGFLVFKTRQLSRQNLSISQLQLPWELTQHPRGAPCHTAGGSGARLAVELATPDDAMRGQLPLQEHGHRSLLLEPLLASLD